MRSNGNHEDVPDDMAEWQLGWDSWSPDVDVLLDDQVGPQIVAGVQRLDEREMLDGALPLRDPGDG